MGLYLNVHKLKIYPQFYIYKKLILYRVDGVSMLLKAIFFVGLILFAIVSSFVSLPPGTQVTELLNLAFPFSNLLTNNVLNGVFFGALISLVAFLIKRNRNYTPPRPITTLDYQETLLNNDIKVDEISELTQIKGVGKKRALDLELAGVNSISDLAKRSPQHLSEKTGIPITQISKWIIEANKIKNSS